MATLPTRELKIGAIIEKALAVLERSSAPALIYMAGMTVVTGAITYFALDFASPTTLGVIEIVKAVIGVVAAYFLLESMVRRTGIRTRGEDDVFLGYLGLSVLYSLGVMLGFILLIIPGLLVMARWSLAQPMLVARGDGVMKALGNSWEQTRGNEFSIIIAALALIAVPIAIIIAAGSMFEREDIVGIVITQLASSATTVVSLSIGVALYGLLVVSRAAPSPSR